MKALIARPSSREAQPHQTEGISYCHEWENPAILCQMRLGKSLIAVRWVKEQGLQTVLLIGPLQVMEGWQRELWLEGENFVSAFDMPANRRKEIIDRACNSKRRVWVLMNYEGLYAISDKERVINENKSVEENKELNIKGKVVKDTYLTLPRECYLPWGAVIADESTVFSNPTSLIGQIMRLGFRQAQHRAILTGAIRPENIMQVFNQFCYLDGHFMEFTDFYEFRFAMFQKFGNFSWFPKPGAEKDIKQYVHARSFVRTRKQVGMKEKRVYAKRHFNMSVKQAKLYRAIETEFTAYLLSGGTWETEWALVRRTWLAKLAGGFDAEGSLVSSAKADDVINLLRGELADEKLIVWFRYRHELEYVYERLCRAKINAQWIMGGNIPVHERQRRMGLFRGRNGRVLLATEGSLKHGVDASAADTMYYYSNTDKADDRIQTLERVVNPFTKSLDTQLLAIDAITRGTIDEDLVYAARAKVNDSKLFSMSPRALFLKRISE